jgi:uncharacterized phage infection (PIP) family protein YhgE
MAYFPGESLTSPTGVFKNFLEELLPSFLSFLYTILFIFRTKMSSGYAAELLRRQFMGMKLAFFLFCFVVLTLSISHM